MGKHRSDKRGRNVLSSDEEDGPDPKVQKNDNGRDDEFYDLFDADEREKLNQMSEKDRETEIFKRIEMNQIMKTREEIKKKLEMTQKAEEKRSKVGVSGGGGCASSSTVKTPSSQGKNVIGSSGSESSNDEEEDDAAEDDSSSSGSSSSSDEEEEESEDEEEEKVSRKSKRKEPEKKKSSTRKKKDSDDDEDDDDFDTEFHRPSELVEKHSKKKAMDVLLSKRRDKKEAEEKRKQKAQKAALDIDEIFGDDDEDSKSGSSSSSSSRSSSPASSRNASPERSPEITTMDELKRCRLSRFRLAQHVHAPYFKTMAVGCFVRIGIGNGPDGTPVYRMAQIMDIVETAKVYQVEKTRTNKGLRIKHGPDERVYRLEFVSNSEFTQSEFQHWMKAMRNKDLPLPTVDFVERKEKEIKNYSNYAYTNKDIDFMVKEKMKFSKSPSNFAFQKGELIKAKEYAEQTGDFHQVQELQRKIDDLDAKADQLDRQRSQKLSVVTWINQRNRDHMKQSFLGSGVTKFDSKREDDPFTRKSGKMRVVSGSSKSKPGSLLATTSKN